MIDYTMYIVHLKYVLYFHYLHYERVISYDFIFRGSLRSAAHTLDQTEE